MYLKISKQPTSGRCRPTYTLYLLSSLIQSCSSLFYWNSTWILFMFLLLSSIINLFLSFWRETCQIKFENYWTNSKKNLTNDIQDCFLTLNFRKRTQGEILLCVMRPLMFDQFWKAVGKKRKIWPCWVGVEERRNRVQKWRKLMEQRRV